MKNNQVNITFIITDRNKKIVEGIAFLNKEVIQLGNIEGTYSPDSITILNYQVLR